MDPAPESPSWSFPRRYLFRFAALYFALFIYPFPAGWIPGTEALSETMVRPWFSLVRWVGHHLLQVESAIPAEQETGSGDRVYDYIQLLIVVVLAAAGSALWSLFARRRRDERRLAAALTIACRYYLGYAMALYGFGKVFPSQFGPPGLERLISTYGASSPMGLLWTFMNQSTLYTMFSGAGEVAGSLLVLFRRTTTLGALILIGVMGNVVMLNVAYDVPVKLFSLHLLLMATALAVLDRRRLTAVFLLNRPAPALDPGASAVPQRDRRIRVLKTLIVAALIGSTAYEGFSSWRTWGGAAPRPPLYGLYEVERFVLDGEDRPPLLTDTTRWRYFIVQWPGFATVRLMNDERRVLDLALDDSNRTLTLTSSTETRETVASLRYGQPSPGELQLDGEIGGATVSIGLRRREADEFLLRNRGFHWINEFPLNR